MNEQLKNLTGIASFCLFHLNSQAQPGLEESIARGKDIYINECIICHMDNGEGITGAFPPLAKSDYFKDDVSKAVDAILEGIEGELVVNGSTYYGIMDPVALSDNEVADVLNYVQNSWGGQAEMLSVKDIEKVK